MWIYMCCLQASWEVSWTFLLCLLGMPLLPNLYCQLSHLKSNVSKSLASHSPTVGRLLYQCDSPPCWMFLTPFLKSSLTPIGSIRYHDFLGVQKNFSQNLEKSAYRLLSPLRLNSHIHQPFSS